MTQLIATGKVVHLCLDGVPVQEIYFGIFGPQGDKHQGSIRELSGHDGDYLKTSSLKRGDPVFNHRSWTGLSCEEVADVEKEIEVAVPPGVLLENICFSGIPNFSKLNPLSRIVFPAKERRGQLILFVSEENGPCRGVGEPLQQLYLKRENLCRDFIKSAQGKRGVIGFVYSAGYAHMGDEVQVYSPV